MNEVVTTPFSNSGWVSTFSRNGMFVLTPRMRASWRARRIPRTVSSQLAPRAVYFTSNES